MTRPTLRHGLLTLAAGAALLGGCGSDDDKDAEAEAKRAREAAAATFNRDARAASAEVSAIGRDLGETIEGAEKESDSALAAAFARLADRSREAVADLEALKPPADARRPVNALVSALGTGARDLDAIAVAARGNNAQAAASATQTLVQDSPAISTANDALKAELEDAGR